jgi:hypothetical protein
VGAGPDQAYLALGSDQQKRCKREPRAAAADALAATGAASAAALANPAPCRPAMASAPPAAADTALLAGAAAPGAALALVSPFQAAARAGISPGAPDTRASAPFAGVLPGASTMLSGASTMLTGARSAIPTHAPSLWSGMHASSLLAASSSASVAMLAGAAAVAPVPAAQGTHGGGGRSGSSTSSGGVCRLESLSLDLATGDLLACLNGAPDLLNDASIHAWDYGLLMDGPDDTGLPGNGRLTPLLPSPSVLKPLPAAGGWFVDI